MYRSPPGNVVSRSNQQEKFFDFASHYLDSMWPTRDFFSVVSMLKNALIRRNKKVDELLEISPLFDTADITTAYGRFLSFKDEDFCLVFQGHKNLPCAVPRYEDLCSRTVLEIQHI